MRTLVEVGWASAVGAVIFAALLGTGTAGIMVGTILFALGAMGWNALVYVSAGERGPADLPAQSVALAATVVFTVAALSSPGMGALADTIGWTAFWASLGAVAVVGALIAMSIKSPRRSELAPAR